MKLKSNYLLLIINPFPFVFSLKNAKKKMCALERKWKERWGHGFFVTRHEPLHQSSFLEYLKFKSFKLWCPFLLLWFSYFLSHQWICENRENKRREDELWFQNFYHFLRILFKWKYSDDGYIRQAISWWQLYLMKCIKGSFTTWLIYLLRNVLIICHLAIILLLC